MRVEPRPEVQFGRGSAQPSKVLASTPGWFSGDGENRLIFYINLRFKLIYRKLVRAIQWKRLAFL